MPQTDWTLLRTFLAVAETGSYSAAARKLGISQPTVGRHIAELERDFGIRLFSRESRGQSLTEAGRRMKDHAAEMKAAAARMSLIATGQTQNLAGSVRITASVVVSHYLLPPILARIAEAEPEIELELHPSDETENLLFHEADIAVRMFRPEQLEVISRKVGSQEFGIYASTSYIARHGRPRTIEDLKGHRFIGYDRSDLILRGMRAMGMTVDRSFFHIRCDNQTVYWQMVLAGAGIGVSAVNIAEMSGGLERVLPELRIPELPIWLTAHAELNESPRIRRVYDMLAEGLAAVAGPGREIRGTSGSLGWA